MMQAAPSTHHNWGIIGAGAIGSLMASMLCDAKQNVVFIDKRCQAKAREYKLSSQGKTQQYCIKTQQDFESVTALLVCLKAWQVLPSLLPELPNIPIVLMHNGMGTFEQLTQSRSEQVSATTIFLSSNTHAARWLEPGHLQHTGVGELFIGNPSHSQQPLWFKDFSRSIINCQWSASITEKLWVKLAVNAAINPLSALNDCNNGELVDESYRPKIQAVCQEVSDVASTQAIKLNPQELVDTVIAVCKLTANNSSSMREDLRNQRPSEVDFINGYIVTIAGSKAIPCPQNSSLLKAIHDQESRYA